jgi:hypothetical protein
MQVLTRRWTNLLIRVNTISCQLTERPRTRSRPMVPSRMVRRSMLRRSMVRRSMVPAVDGPAVDGPAVDGPAVDGPAVDAPKSDGPAVDGPAVDGPAVDGPAVDGPAVDGSSPDAAMDSSAELGCALGTSVSTSASNVVVCLAGSGQSMDQCTAATTVCASGWHMCTASEYRAVAAGAAITAQQVWIAGCIRDGAAPFAPTDAVCSQCVNTTGSEASAAWNCSNGFAFKSRSLHLGLYAHTSCAAAGTNATSSRAYWRFDDASSNRQGALCCKD